MSKKPVIIVTGGSEDGTVPNDFWYKDESGKKFGPYNSWAETIQIHDLRGCELQVGEPITASTDKYPQSHCLP